MGEQNLWFTGVYREHAARLFKQAFYILRDRQLAEDLVEETLRGYSPEKALLP